MPYDFSVDANTYIVTNDLTGVHPFGSAPMSFACWYRYTGSPAAAALLSNYSGLAGDDSVELRYDGANNLTAVATNVGVSTVTSTISTSANVWHHGALTFTTGTNNLIVYEDGAAGTAQTPPTITGLDSFYIGAKQTVDNPFDGLISHVACWNVVLTAAEILSLARGTNPMRIRPQNLQAFWPLRSAPGAVSVKGTPSIVRNGQGHATDRMNLGSLETNPTFNSTLWPPVNEYGWVQDVISLAYEKLSPDADVSDGGWTDQIGGVDLFAAIDEETAIDADYIKSPDVSGGSAIAKISLANLGSAVSEPLQVSYRCGKDGDSGAGLIVRLLQGSTTIASWTHDHLPLSPQTFTQELTTSEFSAITDFDDLYLEFESSSEAGTYSDLTFKGSSVNNTNQTNYTFSSLDFGTPSEDRHILVVSMSGNGGWPNEMRIGGVRAEQWSGVAGTVDVACHVAHVPDGATGSIEVDMAAASTAYAIAWWTVKMGSIGFHSTGGDQAAGANPVCSEASMLIPDGGFAIGITAVPGDVSAATVALSTGYVEAQAEQVTESWTFCPFQREVVTSPGIHTVTATWTANTATEGVMVLCSFRGDGG